MLISDWCTLLSCLLVATSCVAHGCPDDCVCRQDSHFVNCSSLGLSDVPGNLPADTVTLSLQGNDITEIRAGSFAGVEALRALDLSDNRIHSIDANAFGKLSKLSQLNLSRNRIRELHGETLRHSPRLSRLDVTHNALMSLPVGLFHGLRDLSRLHLRGNGLASLEGGVVQPLVGLRDLSLADNPWECDCHLSEMRSWLERYSHRGGAVDEVRCSFPRSLKDRSLASLPADIFSECAPLREYPALAPSPGVTTSPGVAASPGVVPSPGVVASPGVVPSPGVIASPGDPEQGEEAGALVATADADAAAPPFCTVRPKQPPVNVRRAVGTLAVAGVVCGITSLMMVVAAVYGCLYAAMMSRVRGGGGGSDEARERQSLAMEASEEASEEFAKEPLNPSPA
ncbi:leucine-rich repeat and transmembrane domain-containing protein 2-like [Lampetra planeri]